jgi:hypothetical protein
MTTTTLITIAPSSEVNAEPLDDNFKYLNGRINDVTSTATTNTTSINSLSSTINSLVNMPIDTLTQTETLDGYTVALTDGKIGKTTIADKTTFILPTVSSSDVYHQIMVLMSMPTAKTIAFSAADSSTVKYFNGAVPDFSEAGNYTIVCEYDGSNWVVGAVIKKAAS